MKNRLYGDNLPIMPERIATETVDLVHLDHPFQSHPNDHGSFGPSLNAVKQLSDGRKLR
jgi:hypothetical protein